MRVSLLLAAALFFSACDAVDVSSSDAAPLTIPDGASDGADVGDDGGGDDRAIASLFGPDDGALRGRTLAAVRRATARYHSVDRAVADGWGDPVISPCVDDNFPVDLGADLGAMGHHYVNVGLMDGALDPEQPEILLYEPTKNGRVRLVGVEYVVPFGVEPRAADGGTAPELFGQTFHESEGAGGWALHVWVWKNNPSGMFADFNPTVSCEYTTGPPNA